MDTVERVFFGIVVSIFLTIVICVFNVATATGRVDYCYIGSNRNTVVNGPDEVLFDLWGHRSWRADRIIIGDSPTFDDAVASAKLIECEVK